MLNGDAAAERLDAFQIAVGNSFAMIEEPIQSLEWHVTIHVLEYVEETRNTFVVSGVQAERPFVRGQERNHLFQLALQRSGKVGARFQKVFKIRRREHEHFSSAIATKVVVTFAG